MHTQTNKQVFIFHTAAELPEAGPAVWKINRGLIMSNQVREVMTLSAPGGCISFDRKGGCQCCGIGCRRCKVCQS